MIQRDLNDGTYASFDEPVPPLPPSRNGEHEGHERHGLCRGCVAEVHEYPPGWSHVTEPGVRGHVELPADGTVACSCEWDERVARRAGYR